MAAELFLGLLVLSCLFCGQIMTKRSLVYGSEKLFRHAVPGISVWNRYDGKRYFLDDLVRRQNIAGDRSAFYADFHCDCRSLRRSQRMCTGVAGRTSDAADRDLLSVPNLLLVIFLLAAAGKSNVITISAVIGMTSWTSITKVVRTEVRQIRNSEYVIASRCMGGSFFYILWHHLAPNFFSSIMFMVVMNIRSAIVAESTLSFMGIGLPLEVISWGSMLSLSEKALMTKAWWIILIPGVFLIVTLLSFTSIGNYLRKQANRKQRNL